MVRPSVVTAREPFYRVGGKCTFNYRCCLQFNALYMYGHDYNLLPIDASGNLIPLQNLSHPYRLASCIAAGDLQRRLCGCRMAGISLDVRDVALRRSEFEFRPHQRADQE